MKTRGTIAASLNQLGLVAVLAMGITACDSAKKIVDDVLDGGPSDTGTTTPDAGASDTGTPDTGVADAAPGDAEPVDTGTPDADTPDTGPADTAPTDTQPAGPKLGEACAQANPCASGVNLVCVLDDSGQKGSCRQTCSVKDTKCPDGNFCATLEGDLAACIPTGSKGLPLPLCKSCKDDTECGAELCIEDERGSFCGFTCVADKDCPANFTCEVIDDGKGGVLGNSCIPAAGACGAKPKGQVGDPCKDGNECETGFCLLDGPNGYCTAKCANDRECPGPKRTTANPVNYLCTPAYEDKNKNNKTDGIITICSAEISGGKPGGATCDPKKEKECLTDFCTLASDSSTAQCSNGCAADADCPANQKCGQIGLELDEGGEGIWRGCVPDLKPVCRPTNNGVEICDNVDNNCDGKVDEGDVCKPAAASVQTINLGKLKLFANGQFSQVVNFTLPADTASFTLIVEGLGADRGILAQLTDPKGVNLFNPNDRTKSVLASFADFGVYSLVAPNTSKLQKVEPGKYAMRLAKFGAERTVDVKILVKSGPQPAKQKINLNLYFVGVPDIDAAKAKGDPDFQKIVAAINSQYQRAGIEVGDVKYLDITGADRDKFAVIDTNEGADSEFAQLMTLSKNAGNDYVNIFFPKEIAGDEPGFTILGISSGIPGPPLTQGTIKSGTIVALLPDWRKRLDRVTGTITHEVGHFFGLYHTSEADGKFHDPLTDTPECPASKDANKDGRVDLVECVGAGGDNLMFWLSSGKPDLVLSPNQSFVLTRNPFTK
ncbi:MAG: hypothetical protein GMKNLPBB_00580 [Myxococcota bacterium]|nr:hypothetical protein [Myxococcota bacterium]